MLPGRLTMVGVLRDDMKKDSKRCASALRGCAPTALVSSSLSTWSTTCAK